MNRKQQRPELPSVTPTWQAGKYNLHKLHQSHEDVTLVECIARVFSLARSRVALGNAGPCCCVPVIKRKYMLIFLLLGWNWFMSTCPHTLLESRNEKYSG